MEHIIEQEDLISISNQQSMLIIEHNEEVLDVIKHIFKSRYRLYEAHNIEDGFKIAKNLLPDVVLSDIVTEEMSGIKFCKKMKNDIALNHIPVILLTDNLTLDIKLRCIDVGAYDAISKPIESKLLIALVGAIQKKRKHLQSDFYQEPSHQSAPAKLSEEHRQFLNKCNQVIENHLNDEDFSIKTMASELGMSHSNLYKKIRMIYGQSLNGFIRFIRLRKAARLLIHTNCNVNEAAYRVGIYDIKYFREQFNKLFGMNPSEFIKRRRITFRQHDDIGDLIN